MNRRAVDLLAAQDFLSLDPTLRLFHHALFRIQLIGERDTAAVAWHVVG